MTRPPLPRWWPYALGAVLVLAAAAWLWSLRPQPIPPEILPPRVDSALVAETARARVLDSVAAAIRARDDSVAQVQAERESRVAVLVRAAATAESRARTMADAARAAGDTASIAWSAYMAASERGDSLTVALVVSDSARRAEHARAEMWRMAYDSSDASRRRWAGIATELREAVDRAAARDRCRILGALPCPSRTVLAVAGVAAGAAGVLYLDR